MKSSLHLIQDILKMKFPWNIWIHTMAFVNMAGAAYFFPSHYSIINLISMIVAFEIMTLIYKKYGFVRLLGLGHIIGWLPMLTYYAYKMNSINDPILSIWLKSVVAINSISLIIDAIDVKRWFAGEKQSML